jgi:hypothetical protein
LRIPEDIDYTLEDEPLQLLPVPEVAFPDIWLNFDNFGSHSNSNDDDPNDDSIIDIPEFSFDSAEANSSVDTW